MAQRKIWLSWIADQANKTDPAATLQSLKKNGLQVSGGHWVDDVAKAGWAELIPVLCDPQQTDAWVIAVDQASFNKASIRYALSVLTGTAHNQRGPGFPVLLVGIDFQPAAEQLPTFLRACTTYRLSDTGWPAKLVASFFKKIEGTAQEFRFAMHANQYTGQWFEIGPRAGSWNGAMFGVSGDAKITHHAVGPKGAMPERTVLEYAIKDMKATVGDTEFTVWSVQNKVDVEQSYYVKVDGTPPRIVFGGHPGTDDGEAFSVTLS